MERSEIVVTDEAYKWENAPVLLLAGPGTGKTYQLAKRIQYLTTNKNIPADAITVITFTSEAAKSMREKLEKKGGSEYTEPSKRPARISTMHSFGHWIIKENLTALNLQEGFEVVESTELRKILMGDAALLLGFTQKDANDALKDRTEAKIEISKISQQIQAKYEEILRACNAIDHDDQILLACKLLKENPELKSKYCQQTQHLLVDEYQDINSAQFELISLLCGDHLNGLFVVGDDDQSIYSFRGGSPEYIRNFKTHFGENAAILQMQTSRRCLKNILDCAVCVVAKHDSTRVDKGQYQYSKDDPGRVVIHDCPSDEGEAMAIAHIIRDDINFSIENELKGRKSFILVPNKYYAQRIQNVLRKQKIKFAGEFLEEGALKKFSEIKKWAESQGNFATRYCADLIVEGGTTSIPTSKARKNLGKRDAALKEIANLWKLVLSDGKKFQEAISESTNQDIKEIGEKLNFLKSLYDADRAAPFINGILNTLKMWPSREKFFDEIESLSRGSSNGSGSNPADYEVKILTMQKSKGLEAEHVFIIGLEDGTMPKGENDNMAEEARLFFVAMTRAKENLHLLHCRKRTGAVTFRANSHELSKSQFLDVLPRGQFETLFHQAKGKK